VLAGLIAVVLLGQLSTLDYGIAQRRANVSTVFKPLGSKMLTDDNLVDEMAALPAKMRLESVRWDHGILSIDLTASAPADLWLDASSLIRFAFKDKNNVNQLLIRVFNGNNGDHVLLSSLETERIDWSPQELEQLRPTDLELNTEAASHIRMNVTSAGLKWKKNFAN
jgi:hypothetical protein